MAGNIITLCYRKVIDSSSELAWEKLVFEDSYTEFKMQAQLFNQHRRYQTFSQIIQQEEGAEQLHFLVSAAVVGYVQQLGGLVPDILNLLGKRFLGFENFNFEIINSHISDKNKHQVAISFYSKQLIWHNTISDMILVSDIETQNEPLKTHMVRMRPFLSIDTLCK